ncbi:MAG: VOC family protein [Pseudomonadota bacterium]
MAVAPYLAIVDARRALVFYSAAFGAEIFDLVEHENGCVVHAKMRLAGAVVMVHEHIAGEVVGIDAPSLGGHSSVTIRCGLETAAEVDALIERAVRHGAEVTAGPAVMRWGEYYGRLRDPFAHIWAFGAPAAPRND